MKTLIIAHFTLNNKSEVIYNKIIVNLFKNNLQEQEVIYTTLVYKYDNVCEIKCNRIIE